MNSQVNRGERSLPLFRDEETAAQQSNILGHGHLARFEVRAHARQPGYYIFDRQSGRGYGTSGILSVCPALS